MPQDRVGFSHARAIAISTVVFACTAVSLTLSAGCAANGGGSAAPSAVSRIAVAPSPLKTLSVDRQGLLRVNSLLLAPVQFHGNARLESNDQERLDRELEFAAGRELDVDVTPPSKAVNLISKGTAADQFAASAVASAKKFKSDGVILTTISTLEERDGSRVGTDSPAAFGFTMSLLRSDDSRIVWSSSYFVQDHAVTDNLLTARDAGWRSLQDHLTAGFSAALRELRVQRETAFGTGGK